MNNLTRHEDIIADLATLIEQVKQLRVDSHRLEQKLDKIDKTVHGEGGHAEQIASWKRTGKILGFALTGLGAVAMAWFQWFLAHWK